MSGWYVEVLLTNKHLIKSRVEYEFPSNYDDVLDIFQIEMESFDDSVLNVNEALSLDDDTYNDLLDVERMYNTLVNENIISDDEINSLNYILTGGNIYNASRISGIHRSTLTKNFKSLCSKIAYFLGGHFTDDGYIDYIRRKYKLNNTQVEELSQYIRSIYKLGELSI